MTALTRPTYRPGRLTRLVGFLVNGVIGTVLCTGPVTAVIALGWLTRRQGHFARDRFGAAEEGPGWLFGPREVNGRPTGRLARAVGGLAANIRSGLMALSALLAWTLPFTLLWLGAWWAGWENSFNKGYEQAFVGPSVFDPSARDWVVYHTGPEGASTLRRDQQSRFSLTLAALPMRSRR